MKKLLLIFLSVISLSSFGQPKKFNWVAWGQIAVNVKSRLKAIQLYQGTSVYSDIVANIKAGDTAFVAVIDLDGDGKPGYAVAYTGAVNCGAAGCAFAVYEQDGRTRISLTDHWQAIKPVKNGVLTSEGKYIALRKYQGSD